MNKLLFYGRPALRNPDDVMLDIKYHFVWNVIGRRPAFKEPATTIDFISDTITTCSDAVSGFASLLWLAPDHMHLYVESDGEVSPDNMAQELKRLSEAPLLERFPEDWGRTKVTTFNNW